MSVVYSGTTWNGKRIELIEDKLRIAIIRIGSPDISGEPDVECVFHTVEEASKLYNELVLQSDAIRI